VVGLDPYIKCNTGETARVFAELAGHKNCLEYLDLFDKKKAAVEARLNQFQEDDQADLIDAELASEDHSELQKSNTKSWRDSTHNSFYDYSSECIRLRL
jgi:hypothetical protein